jgi:hypothetical protein
MSGTHDDPAAALLAAILANARALDLPVPEACCPGVAAAAGLLSAQLELLRGFALDWRDLPASSFVP